MAKGNLNRCNVLKYSKYLVKLYHQEIKTIEQILFFLFSVYPVPLVLVSVYVYPLNHLIVFS